MYQRNWCALHLPFGRIFKYIRQLAQQTKSHRLLFLSSVCLDYQYKNEICGKYDWLVMTILFVSLFVKSLYSWGSVRCVPRLLHLIGLNKLERLVYVPSTLQNDRGLSFSPPDQSNAGVNIPLQLPSGRYHIKGVAALFKLICFQLVWHYDHGKRSDVTKSTSGVLVLLIPLWSTKSTNQKTHMSAHTATETVPQFEPFCRRLK